MKWPWSPRYQAVIVGMESGNRSPVPFQRFRTEQEAIAWCERMNGIAEDSADPITIWDYEELP